MPQRIGRLTEKSVASWRERFTVESLRDGRLISDLRLRVEIDGGGVVDIVSLAGMKAAFINGNVDPRNPAGISGQLYLISGVTTIMTDGTVLSAPHDGKWQSEVEVVHLSPEGERTHVEYREPVPVTYVDSFRGFRKK